MKATFDIDEGVVQQLQEVADLRGTTVDALVEAAIRVFAGLAPTVEAELRPLPSWPMGRPLVDVSDRRLLYDTMDDWDRLQKPDGGKSEE